ncbi:uncharacterized protein LOC102715419 [Oryza brachyantha]|uniref:Uncharacterized protein n=1 Tax=Oryza brachyantha TaxID=4533 RepID=J3MZV6_ORYBR|nr:uncharacterized protein LOC102715419 [Oryza brachyantha]XP_015696512.1 uncharacterized protein LOC102715419 [Oryza brachyantha]XP_015696514.1 uncharacterized protein LOC102715419 [Oryza brachyantha]XP_040383827.1 uncharacterized protein LOC102715419 [Oryza brachyantha]
MPAGENPHSISEKKAALRESPKESKNVGNQQPRVSPISKDKAAETVGIKRPQPNGPPGANGHLVYVRRRLETDHCKVSPSASAESISSLSSKKTVVDKPEEQSLKRPNSSLQTLLAPVFASPAAAAATSPTPSGGLLAQNSLRKQSPVKVVVQPSIVVTASPPCNMVSTAPIPQNSVATNLTSSHVTATSTASHGAVATTTACYPADQQRSSNQDWKERFIRLQAFLRNNEQSGQEEYIHMLRSLSSVGRSKHAIELENRAVKLLVEEGKELQKMKVLNVLNKLSPTDSLSLPTQPASVRHLAFPPR